MKHTLLPFFILISCTAFSQPAIDWAQCYGSSFFDQASSIAPTPDGGTISAGYVLGNDGDVSGMHLQFGDEFYDGWIVKTSPTGEILWQRCYGGSQYENFESITVVPGNGYIVCGESQSLDDGDVTGHHGGLFYDAWVVKIDEDGNIEWQKSLGGDDYDYAMDIRVTADGGYIVACKSQSEDGDVGLHYGSHLYADIWMVKLDSIGNIVWSKVIGGTKAENAAKVLVNDDGTYVVAGSSLSKNNDVTDHHGPDYASDAWVVKLDSAGNIIWSHSYGGNFTLEGAGDIAHTSDGGYMIFGSAVDYDSILAGFHGETDYMVIKTDEEGNEEWTKYYGTSSGDFPDEMEKLSDSTFMLCGYTSLEEADVSDTIRGYQDYWLLKIDESGDILWNETFGGSGADECFGSAILTDGSIALCGYSASEDGNVTGLHGTFYYDFWIVKLDPECELPVAGFSMFNNHANYFFSADSSSATEWYWDFGDGSSSTEEDPEHIYADTGTYYVCLIVTSFCGSDSTCNYITYSTPVDTTDTTAIAIDNLFPEGNLRVFPNPVPESYLYLHADIPGEYDLTIADLSGKMVWERRDIYLEEKFTIDINDISAGIYTLTAKNKESSRTFRIMIN